MKVDDINYLLVNLTVKRSASQNNNKFKPGFLTRSVQIISGSY